MIHYNIKDKQVSTKNPKIIIFNGAAGSGKDEAVSYLRREYGVYGFSFKRTLKRITLELYQIPEEVWDSWYSREGKELPREELGGLSQRQVLIKVSEKIIKPNFGPDYFGKSEAKRLLEVVKDNPNIVAACSDGGFNHEVVPFIDYFGDKNVFIVQIHRPGCNFANDSRNWIDLDQIPLSNYWSIANNSSLDDYWDNLDTVYKYILSK